MDCFLQIAVLFMTMFDFGRIGVLFSGLINAFLPIIFILVGLAFIEKITGIAIISRFVKL